MNWYFRQADVAEEMFAEMLADMDLTSEQLEEFRSTGCITVEVSE
jgi:hypothetical protein